MNLKKYLNKKNILMVIIIVWILFSIGYIAYDQWQRSILKESQKAYQKGVNDLIQTIINQTSQCQPLSIFDGEKKIEIIDISCQK